MKRKVVKQGPSTFMVSLPASWVKSNNLKKGDELEIKPDANMLFVSTTGDEWKTKKICLDVSDLNERGIDNAICMMHKKGFGEIMITYDSQEQLNRIQKMVHLKPGYEIIRQHNKRCLIKSILKGDLQNIDVVLQRLFMIVKTMISTASEKIRSKKFDELKEILVLEASVNKLSHCCERELITSNSSDDNTHLTYIIIWCLESFADQIAEICQHKSVSQLPSTHAKVLKLFDSLQELFESFRVAYFNYKNIHSNRFYELHTEYMKKVHDSFNKISKDEYFFPHYMGVAGFFLFEAFSSLSGLHIKETEGAFDFPNS